jgi:hypothetical protein
MTDVMRASVIHVTVARTCNSAAFLSLLSNIPALRLDKLIFEPLNEAPGITEVDAAEFNKLNDIFLTNLNAAGGYNPHRVVSLSRLSQDPVKTSQWFNRSSLYPDQL